MSVSILNQASLLPFGAAGYGLSGAFPRSGDDLGMVRERVIGARTPRRPPLDSWRQFAGGSVLLGGMLAVVLASSVLALVVLALIDGYFAHLDGQAAARLRSLPRALRDEWQPLYPGVDLARVRYAEQIDTVHGQGITVGLRIYFPRSIDLDSPIDRHWLAHELQHCSQYGADGRVDAFLRSYFSQVARQVIANRSFDVHDRLGLEVEAERKAIRVAPVAPRWSMDSWATGAGKPPASRKVRLMHPIRGADVAFVKRAVKSDS